MKAAFNALCWDVLRKNRLVFLALFVLLGVGAAVAVAGARAEPEAAWLAAARGVVVGAFLVSLVLGLAPFTLMESQGGWRMNSMLTRWFVLPASTAWLVALPMLAGPLAIALLIAAWTPVLDRIAPGLDGVDLAAVLAVGLIAVQTLAWLVPRKPGQFWTGTALALPVVLIFALSRQDLPGGVLARRGALIPLAYAAILLAAFAGYAARRNRCGDWPGEIPLDRLWQCLRGGGFTGSRRRYFRSATMALFWSDSLPLLRLLAVIWLGVGAVLFVYFSLTVRDSQRELAFSLRLLTFTAINILPLLSLPCLALWGLFAGAEPGVGFRTRMASFRAALPLRSGALAGQKIVALALGWGLVWLPAIGLLRWHDGSVSGMNEAGMAAQVRTLLAWLMAAGAGVTVGALPLVVWGRFDGFPHLLLAGVSTWGGIWLVGANLPGDGDATWRTLLPWALLGAKALLAIVGCAWAWRAGHITRLFPLALVIGWAGAAALLIGSFSIWEQSGLRATLNLLVFLPLARLAWTPLALAANRHR